VERADGEVIATSIDDPRAFGALFDRHAGLLFRFLVRRVGPDVGDDLLGETFRIAFERRASFDVERPSARPWLYGIATNLLARHRRAEARRLRATAALASRTSVTSDPADGVAGAVDAAARWQSVTEALADLPDGERDALLLFAWEELSYEEVADALEVPVGTVRSRLNRARRRLREPTGARGEEVVSTLPPDRLQPAEPNDPFTLAEEKERLMSTIEQREATWKRYPAMYARLGYEDEHAALEWLERVFGFTERREARMEDDADKWGILAWLELDDGVVMIGRSGAEHHGIFSPRATGGKVTCMVNVFVDDVDAHYERAVAGGAEITMELNDAFYGYRRYEARDLDGHSWHFAEPLEHVRQRRGDQPAPG
jgi:RNA polymerase sigma-70 factor (ECF subfamily)